ncbi:hypothetical protein ISF_00104 [Cordyceps fumosorosea ARSEF 2679]|uniref:DUF1746 domain-containing protein n=1 Tax=Cordyceps fumosorosea (strain ARSEF 2679) TaxID=1081104 RepID=A0A168DZV8_CORFA|nr:hypothetical protein ISF_00104 [Cordyceps fumosorosea ARSEF 2679]OAA73203.1 hypothetical protein ISF_00104 [Cordyceps fumosorosea ARSEF 2679]
MNDDASLSSSAQDELWDDDDVGTSALAQSQTDAEPAQQSEPRAQSAPQQRRPHSKKDMKKHCPGLKKKLAFLTHLLKTLDLVVFAELSALYYMECSMFRFLLRAFGQHFHLSPKDEAFPVVMPASRVQLVFVMTPNIICILLHLFTSLPVGRDDQRGYQHGGLVIDFIGQKPSTSRAYYVLADILILVLQCVMLTIHAEREQMRVTLKTFRPLAADLAQQAAAGRTLRELDEEERGVSAMLDEEAGDEAVDVEMRLLDQGADSATEEAGPSNSNRADDTDSTTHLSNVMDSGNGPRTEQFYLH